MSLTNFGQRIVIHPWKTILLSLAVVGFISYFLKDVAPSISYKDMLGEDYPLLKSYEKIQQEFTSDDNLLVLIESKEDEIFTREIIEGVIDLTSQLWQTPYSVRVDSVTNFQHTKAQGDDLYVDYLVPETSELNDDFLNEVKSIALAEPQLLNRGVNLQGNVLAISVSFTFPNKDMNEKLEANAFVERLVNDFSIKHPNTNTYISGLIALDATVMKISQRESGLFLLMIIVIVALLMSLFLRVLKPVLMTVLVIILSVIAGMAFSGMMGWKLTPFTASVPLMILVLATADCVHFISNVIEKISTGMDKQDAIVDSFRLNFSPIAITSLTTAVGFLTLNFSDSESIGALGSQVAFGVMIAFLLSVTLLPASLSLVRLKVLDKSNNSDLRFSHWFASKVYRYKTGIVTMGLLIFAGLGIFVTSNEFNDNIPTYFAKSLPWRQANDFAEREFGGAYTFSYVLRSGQENGIVSPEFLNDVEKFSAWLRAKRDVASVSTFTDTIKRINKSMHGDDSNYYKLPDDKELISQYLLLYEMSLPFGLDLNNQLNFDKSATKVVATFSTLSTTEILALEEEVNQWAQQNIPAIQFEATGVQMMFAHLLDKDTRGLVIGAGLGLIVISLLLILAFRSLKFGLISIVPNLVPVIVGFGIWGLFVGQVGMGMAMVSGITIGVVVDDTVHFLYKYMIAKNTHHMTNQAALQYAYENAGRAICFTTLILVAGFLAMALLSEFRVNSDLGKMACIVMINALIVDLIFLPALLVLFDKKRESVEAPEAPLENLI